jgi:hypothetical protein
MHVIGGAASREHRAMQLMCLTAKNREKPIVERTRECRAPS